MKQTTLTRRSLSAITATSLVIAGLAGLTHAEPATKEAPTAAPATKEAPAATKKLGVGDPAPALKDIKWLQGEAVNSLDEKGKLYIVECWATWCGPCVSIIPHINDLHNKFADQGLVVIGMNVFEEGEDAATKFLKDQGDKMSYRVAYSGGEKGDFSTSWLKASGTQGIPSAFVIKDGQIIFHDHPGSLTEAKIEEMLSADFNLEASLKKQEAEAAFMTKAQELFKKQDWDALKTLATTDPFAKGKVIGASILGEVYMQNKEWDNISTLIKDIAAGNYGEKTKATELIGMGFAVLEAGDKAPALAAQLAPLYATEGEPAESNYFGRLSQARILFLGGQKDAGVAKLTSLIESLQAVKDQPGADQFIAKIEEILKATKDGAFPVLK